MDKKIVIDELKRQKEVLPYEYEGTYRSVRLAIESYSSLRKISLINYNDLELIYYLSLGIWSTDRKELKTYIQRSHILHGEKAQLENKLEKIWNNNARSSFTHVLAGEEKVFLTSPVSFKDTYIAKHSEAIQSFFKLCMNVLDIENDYALFDTVQKVFGSQIKNSELPLSVLSRILHCMKPFTFPILGENMTEALVFRAAGLKLNRPNEVSQYISNSKEIFEFRNANFKFKNMRVFDIMSWELFKAQNAPEHSAMAFSKKQLSKPNPSLNTILYGPPGTGKTYNIVKYAVELIEGKKIPDSEPYSSIKAKYEEYASSGQIKFTTFHQSLSYEEFVEGIRPVVVDKYGNETSTAHADTTIVYRPYNGIFKLLCEKATKSSHMNFIAIIDEINRGNISRIFGELITLIEDSKRGTSIILPYSQAEFSVPPNLYILGTMNTADRSIAMLDTALRRRFDFIEMMPDPSLLGNCDGVDLCELLSALNERIEYYYDREHAIGHAYFMKNNNCIKTLHELREVFSTKIIPLLQEYFFDDYERIRLILNDENTFIECITPKYIKQFDSGQKLYRLGNPIKWKKEHFINIYKDIS